MMKLKLKQGEYVDIGENVRVVFAGGSMNKISLLIDAPREMHIERSANIASSRKQHYYKDTPISEEAQNEIRRILKEEKQKNQMVREDQRQYEMYRDMEKGR